MLTPDKWIQRRLDLLMEMLHLMSKFFGYRFSKAQIARDIYSPRAYGDLEIDQTARRQGIVALLKGEISLPMAVKKFPATKPSVELQAALTKILADAKRT